MLVGVSLRLSKEECEGLVCYGFQGCQREIPTEFAQSTGGRLRAPHVTKDHSACQRDLQWTGRHTSVGPFPSRSFVFVASGCGGKERNSPSSSSDCGSSGLTVGLGRSLLEPIGSEGRKDAIEESIVVVAKNRVWSQARCQ